MQLKCVGHNLLAHLRNFPGVRKRKPKLKEQRKKNSNNFQKKNSQKKFKKKKRNKKYPAIDLPLRAPLSVGDVVFPFLPSFPLFLHFCRSRFRRLLGRWDLPGVYGLVSMVTRP